MSWSSRRRPATSTSAAGPLESSSLEVDRSRYATFTGSFPRKESSCGFLDYIRGRAHSFWTISSVAIGAVLVYRTIHHHHHHHHESSSPLRYDMTPISVWNHNHYVSKDSPLRERNLLIAQVGQSRPLAEVTSRPNRAYARRWGWDYLMHTGEEDPCGTVQVLNHIARQERETDGSRAPYDAVLMLSPDSVIMDLDYQFLALLPNDMLVAASSSKSDLFVWNLKYRNSLEVARLWLDLNDSNGDECDMESLWTAIEMTMGDETFDLTNYVQPLQLTDTGLVEPRLIKFLPDESEQKATPETMELLERVADSVCYRYYPRCEVL